MATDPASQMPEEGPAPPTPGPRRRRWLVKLIRIPLLVYVGVALIFSTFQAKLIFPGSETKGQRDSVIEALPDAELVTLTTARGDRIVALFGKALNADGSPRSDASSCPTLLYFYGNAMCLRDASEQLGTFRRLGANVMIPEYVGYGMSEGHAGESGCRETAEAALAHLESRPDVDREKIVVAGWSLGGAVAIDLASRHRVAGLATFCTFTRMADMARRIFPFLPASLLLRHRFENLAKIASIDGPILIGHGRRDQIIPFAMADRLAEAAKGPVTRVTIDEADHNDFFQVGGSRVMTPLRRFLDQIRDAAGKPNPAE
jgi:fermentation-respiration switch protein FrsA (DUF1100 family)